MTVTGGATATLSVAVATDAGTDAGSGVDTGSLVVERQEADLDNGDGTCDAFGSWTTVTLTAGADTGVVSGKCYRYRVRSSDLVGNEATSAASATVQVDTAAPGVTLDDPGANLAGAVTLSATAMDAASGIASVVFQRSPADAGTWTTITGSWDTTGVAEGLYDLRAIATDAAGNATTSAVVEDRRVDNASPDTTIDTAPADPDNDATPTFVFSSTESGSTFQCRFDGGAWGGCASPLTTGALPDGARTFEVRAVDASANPDPTPASHAWVLDTIAPSGGSITVADGWDTDGSVAIATDNGTDIGGSGVAAASTIVEREAATLTTGTCGSFDAAWSAVATPDASVAGGACYRYRLRVRDHAGNWATYPSASVVKVDLTAPTVPALTLANVSGTHVAGTTAHFRPGTSGSFTVTPASTDAESGGVTFSHPNLGTGWSRAGTTWSFDPTAGRPERAEQHDGHERGRPDEHRRLLHRHGRRGRAGHDRHRGPHRERLRLAHRLPGQRHAERGRRGLRRQGDPLHDRRLRAGADEPAVLGARGRRRARDDDRDVPRRGQRRQPRGARDDRGPGRHDRADDADALVLRPRQRVVRRNRDVVPAGCGRRLHRHAFGRRPGVGRRLARVPRPRQRLVEHRRDVHLHGEPPPTRSSRTRS